MASFGAKVRSAEAAGSVVGEIRVYFEGDRALAPGFNKFFGLLRDQARERRCGFRLISCRSGSKAVSDHDKALRNHPAAWNILLMDSEGPCKDPTSRSVFWMVEMMESWFHADKEALEKFYGRDFNQNALTRNPKVEEIQKADLKKGLSEATRNTRKGDYFEHKTSHGPRLLELIDPEKVREAAPQCKRLFTTVLTELANS